MTFIKRALWALVFVAILSGIGKLGWDHFQEGVSEQKALDSVVTLSAANFGSLITPGEPILMMLCTPDICKEMKPLAAELQKQYEGKAKIVLLDGLASSDICQKVLSVTASVLGPFPVAFPTVIILDKDTKPVAYKVGFGSVDELKAMLDKTVLSVPATPAK